MTILNYLGTAAAVIGMIAGWHFVYEYHQVGWNENQAGRHLMRFSVGISIILTYVVAFQVVMIFFELNRFLVWTIYVGRAAIFSWVAWELIARGRVLRHYQRASEAESAPVHD